MLNQITVKGARENNLKNVSLTIPKNKFVVFTGVSGSGKSSMAFDTLFAEGQRRYIESLSSYARQFLGNLKRPEVDLIEGLSPSIAINQKAISHNPRSTVGTVTEIYDYLRLLFARIGHPHCHQCGREVIPQTSKQIVNQILATAQNEITATQFSYRFLILAPVVTNKAGDFRGLSENLRKQGYKQIRVDGKIISLYADIGIIKTNKHNIDAQVDRLSLSRENLKHPESVRDRLTDSVESALKLSNGLVVISKVSDSGFDFPEVPQNLSDTLYSENYACPTCLISMPPLEPRLFSFNSPQGACSECHGLGFKYQFDKSAVPSWKVKYFERKIAEGVSDTFKEELDKFLIKEDCPRCQGSRLCPEALSVNINGQNIYQISQLPIESLYTWAKNLSSLLQSDQEIEILKPINNEISSRLEFLLAVGLDYLSLSREAGTLSSGESQRIRLASQIGTGLTGVLYILDEPTIGLHSRDNTRLIGTLMKLKDLGNTVVVVEHDEDVIRNGDYIVDFGLYAGKKGGEVVAQGSLDDILKSKTSLTGQYLSGKKQIGTINKDLRSKNQDLITLVGCRQWNLKNITVSLPVNRLVCVTGVSGSGKSTLVHDTLFGGLRKKLLGSYYGTIGDYKDIIGAEFISDVLLVDQSPIGRTPRSNPATYTKIFDDIRSLLADTPEAKLRGFKSGRFSFNVKSGRCEACEGQGQIKIEMQFLPDIYVTCDECHGSRFKDETLEVQYKGKNIAEILALTFDEAAGFFANIPKLSRKINTIQEVGLGYLSLGQSSNTLSGGESQRLKISRELVKRFNGRILYIMDEPTTGLHFYDIDRLIKVLRRLVDMGNTVVVIEHNLDVIKNADWIVDLGPEGGDKGGYLVAQGTVEDIVKAKNSYTGQYLKKHLGGVK
ncbi:MAG: excinuclease ABC subunit UvrA [Candidatus Shapirobacteria bacterium]